MIKDIEIRSISASPRTTWRHLLLYAEGGAVGIGEFTLEDPGIDIDGFVRNTVSKLLDEEPDRVKAGRLPGGPIDLRRAVAYSALDQALTDLLAKTSDRPLWQWLNPQAQPTPIPLYANINRRSEERTAASFQESASRAVSSGFEVVKIAPFDGLRPEICSSREGDKLIERALERIAAVAECLPANGGLQVDCHWRLTAAKVHELLRALADLKVTWLECPVPEVPEFLEDIANLRRAANNFGIRLAGCETMTGWGGFRPFLDAECYDVIMPDVKYVGGFDQLKEVADRASERGVAISLHNPSGPICHAHSLHAAAALQLSERIEVQFMETPMFEALTTPALSTACPIASLPDGNGIGVTLLSESSVAALTG